MARRYILGEGAARWLHDAMNATKGGRRESSPVLSDALAWPDPWTLRYSASVITSDPPEEGEELDEEEIERGGWIIWLPEGSWSGATVTDDEESEYYMRPLTPSFDNMPEGWYLLPADMSEVLSADTGDYPTCVYAERRGDVICLTLDETGVLVAKVSVDEDIGSKDVMQILRGPVVEPVDRGCWRIRKAVGSASAGFDNPYFMVGSRIYAATNLANFGELDENKIVALVVNISGSQPSASIQQVSSFSELQALADYQSNAVFPLYETDETGCVKADLRNVPTIAAKEYLE